MTLLPFDPIGTIKLHNVYEYYDEPLVFSFYSELGNLHLANLVDIEEEEDEHIWAYLPITNKELLLLESQEISLFELYKNSASTFTYILTENNNSRKYDTITMDEFPNEYLPDKDSFIRFTRNTINDIQLIEDKSISSNRYVVDLSLEPKQSHEHEIDANLLGRTLIDFQSLLLAVGAPKKSLKTARPSNKVRQDNQLKVTGFYAASFGIRMESESFVNFLNDDPIAKNLEYVIKLLSNINDYNETLHLLNSLSQKSKFVFLTFIELLKENQIDGKISFAIPKGNDTLIQAAVFKEKDAHNFYNKALADISIHRHEITIDGVLLAFDSRASSFKFTSKESDYEKIYSGKLSENITDSISSIPREGIATILVETETKVFTDESTYKYTLESWSPNS